MKKINHEMLFVILFPLVCYLAISAALKYLMPLNSSFILLPYGALLTIGIVTWWKMAKPFLFATDIKIVKESEA